MLKIYNCIATAHDLRLVALAALICTLASLTAINLLRHARGTSGPMRYVWLAISAISTGFGIWATHFVAMLAFSPGVATGYNVVLTILSLIVAILLTGAGLAVALIPNFRAGPFLGGSVVAMAIAAMHYTGIRIGRVRRNIRSNCPLDRPARHAATLEDRRRRAADAGDLPASFHRHERGDDHPRFLHRNF